MAPRFFRVRLLGLLVVGLASAPVGAQGDTPNPTVLEERIDALGQQIETQRQAAEEVRAAREGERDEEVESIRREIDTRVWALQTLFGGFVALVTAGAFVLAFLGWRWTKEQIEVRAGILIEGQLDEDRVLELVEAQSRPMIERLTTEIERRTADVEERLAKMESDAAKELQRIVAGVEQQAKQLASESPDQDERSRGEVETLSRTIESVKPNRDDWTVWEWLIEGNRASATGNEDDALAAYDRALALDPHNAIAHSNRGAALNRLGRYEDALAALDRALALDPSNGIAHNNRGFALDSLGRYEDALAAFDRALALNPNYDVAHSNRGCALNRLGRYDDALAALDRALHLDTEHPAPYYHKARAYVHLERFGDAENQADEALHRSNGLPDAAYRNAASLYIKTVARLLQGKQVDDEHAALTNHLAEPFVEPIALIVFDEPLTDAADVQAEIDSLSDLLRAHAAAHSPAGGPAPPAGDG